MNLDTFKKLTKYLKVLEGDSKVATVKFEHYRPPLGAYLPKRGSTPPEMCLRYFRGRSQWVAHPKGGYTVCTITLEDGSQFQGIGYCSVNDCFEFASGRKYAYKRAVEAALDGKQVVKQVQMVDGQITLVMPLEDAEVVGSYLNYMMNAPKVSVLARNKLYKAMQNVKVFGFRR